MTRRRKIALAGGIFGVLSAAIATPLVNAANGAAQAPSAAAATVPTGACSSADGQLKACLPPVVMDLDKACPRWPATGLQTFDYADSKGVVSQATFSNGSQPCLRVRYMPPAILTASKTACNFYFYVPVNGYANAPVTFGWWNATGKHYAATVPEATVGGWYQLDMGGGQNVPDHHQAIGVTRLEFQDNNGAPYASSYIGWGKNAAYGIQEMC